MLSQLKVKIVIVIEIISTFLFVIISSIGSSQMFTHREEISFDPSQPPFLAMLAIYGFGLFKWIGPMDGSDESNNLILLKIILQGGILLALNAVLFWGAWWIKSYTWCVCWLFFYSTCTVLMVNHYFQLIVLMQGVLQTEGINIRRSIVHIPFSIYLLYRLMAMVFAVDFICGNRKAVDFPVANWNRTPVPPPQEVPDPASSEQPASQLKATGEQDTRIKIQE